MYLIQNYRLGQIVIDKQIYTSDLIIYPNYIKCPWIRKEGHELNIEDLDHIVEYKPDFLIIGTGAFGKLVINEKTASYLTKNKILYLTFKTQEAVNNYNNAIISKKNVIAALHLTC